jgi:putative oxidoreductase
MTAHAMPMPEASRLKQHAIAARATLARMPQVVFDLIFRASVAVVFFKSGMVKIQSWDLTVQLFADEYRVPLLPPEFAAYLATAAELICPVLLVLGLGARLSSLALLGMTAVIQIFVYPNAYADHLLWAGPLLWVLTRGPGAVSIDHIIARRWLGVR